MVVADFPLPADEAVARLGKLGVHTNPAGVRPGSVRLVCHLDLSAQDIDEAVSRVRELLSGQG